MYPTSKFTSSNTKSEQRGAPCLLSSIRDVNACGGPRWEWRKKCIVTFYSSVIKMFKLQGWLRMR